MKAIRNVVIVGLLAATPLAFAHREGAGGKGEGCQGMQSSEGMQQRHAERHARMAAMHQGMHGMQGEGRGHRHGQAGQEEKAK
jgi:hypothetical protein